VGVPRARFAIRVLRRIVCVGEVELFGAMAHDCVQDWMVTRPPLGQTAVEFIFFVTSFVLPRMRACVARE